MLQYLTAHQEKKINNRDTITHNKTNSNHNKVTKVKSLLAILLIHNSLLACCCVFPCDSTISSAFTSHDNAIQKNLDEQIEINKLYAQKLKYKKFNTKEIYQNNLDNYKITSTQDTSLNLSYQENK